MHTTQLFDRILRVSPEAKDALTFWLVECFHHNADRAKMAVRMDPRASLAAAISTASDGFFLNLSWVLLRLCAPFSSQGGGVKRSARIASIDPTYCTVAGGSESAVVDFRGDSKLVPGDVCVCVCVVWCRR